MLLDQSAFVVKADKIVGVCDEHVIALVHGCDAPMPPCFDCVEFAAVGTKAVQGIYWVRQVMAAVAAVHPSFHSDSPVGERVNKSGWIHACVNC